MGKATFSYTDDNASNACANWGWRALQTRELPLPPMKPVFTGAHEEWAKAICQLAYADEWVKAPKASAHQGGCGVILRWQSTFDDGRNCEVTIDAREGITIECNEGAGSGLFESMTAGLA